MVKLHYLNALVIIGSTLPLSGRTEFTENVDFYTIREGIVAVHFTFTQSLPLGAGPLTVHNFNYGHFPRPMVELTKEYELEALRVSMTRGRWDYENWGTPPVEPASIGIDVSAATRVGKDDIASTWRRLASTLSGVFCASINLINERNSYGPKWDAVSGTLKLRGQLSGEAVCTENLTPWSKLLPCSTFAGLAGLLNPSRIFDSSFHQFDVQLSRSRQDSQLALIQNLLVVFDLHRHDQSLDWTLVKLFDRKVSKLCPVSSSTRFNLIKPISGGVGNWKAQVSDDQSRITLDATSFQDIELLGKDIGITGVERDASSLQSVPLQVSRYLTGVGQERGGLVVSWRNLNDHHSLTVSHNEILPDYIHVFLSQLQLHDSTGSLPLGALERLAISPSVARSRPLEIDLRLQIPPGAAISLEIPFEKDYLRYTDFPFDPNRGFDINGATVKFTDPVTGAEQTIVTPKLLLTMPTPDFTMPYNVITLTSTVIVLFYGTIFNVSYRRFYLGPTAIVRFRNGIIRRIQSLKQSPSLTAKRQPQ